MKVAVAQLRAGPDREQNVERTLEAMRRAARQGGELLVLPELCISPYFVAQDLSYWAEDLAAGSVVARWQREAQKLGLYLVAGVLEKADEGYFNTALVLGPQGVLARYRKAHLFGWERKHLLAGVVPGLVVDLEGTKIGLLICYDLRFVEAVRLLALQGACLLCVPTTWTDIGKPQPLDERRWCAAAHLALGHAYANKMFVLCAGRTGREGEVSYLGNSLIASPGGQMLAGPADPKIETTLVVDLDPHQAEDKRVGQANDVLKDRRAQLYSALGSGGHSPKN